MWAVYNVVMDAERRKTVNLLGRYDSREHAEGAAAVARRDDENAQPYSYQVLPYSEAYKERVAHGVGFPQNLDNEVLWGDLNHLLNPIIGILSSKASREGAEITARDAEYIISRLRAALEISKEILL